MTGNERLKDDILFYGLMLCKGRTALLCGERGFRALSSYIRGYLHACSDHGCGAFTLAWFDEFQGDVIERCNGTPEAGLFWTISVLNKHDDDEAVDVFYELLEAFAEEYADWHPYQKISPLRAGEVRIFRLDAGACLFSVNIQENLHKLFGLPEGGAEPQFIQEKQSDGSCAFAVYDPEKTEAVTSLKDLPDFQDIPAFTFRHKVKYQVRWTTAL